MRMGKYEKLLGSAPDPCDMYNPASAPQARLPYLQAKLHTSRQLAPLYSDIGLGAELEAAVMTRVALLILRTARMAAGWT